MSLDRLVAGPVARLRRRWRRACTCSAAAAAGRPTAAPGGRVLRGLLTIVIALDSPIDTYADQLFWVHMLQHILLLTVAPPLFLLGRPWPRMWRALPLEPRTSLGADARPRALDRAAAGARPAAAGVDPVQRDDRRLAHPRRLRRDAHLGAVHVFEHAMFFFTGPAVLGARDRSRAAAPAAGLAGADRLHGRRDGRRLGARDHAGRRPAPDLRLLRGARRRAPAGSAR